MQDRYFAIVNRMRDQMERLYGCEIEYQRDGMPSATFVATPVNQSGSVWEGAVVSPSDVDWLIRVSHLNANGFKQPKQFDRIVDDRGRIWRVVAGDDGGPHMTVEIDGAEVRVHTKLRWEEEYES